MIAKMSWRNLIKGVPTVFNCGCKVPKRVLPNLWIMSETDLRTKSQKTLPAWTGFQKVSSEKYEKLRIFSYDIFNCSGYSALKME